MQKKLFHYSGIIHAHSTYSDGQKSIPEIAAIANELKADFLLMSDHNTLQPKLDGLEGWYGNTLVGIGSELNDKDDKNHYLAFNIERPVNHKVSASDYMCKVREQGGFGIIAHPDETRTHIEAYPPYPWTLWDSDCYDGIEIWNQMSEWMEGLTHFNKFWRAMHPRRSIISPKKETLARWDEGSLKRKITGVGGVDAHGHIHRMLGMFSVRIFRYKVSFRTIRTHILSEQELPKNDYRAALQILFNNIREAQCFVSNSYLGNACAFRFWAENDVSTAQMGGTLSINDDTRLNVVNPEKAETRLIHNGEEIIREEGSALKFKITEPGIYRVEIRKNGKAWIFSNHIRISATA